jgi:hypothetical protein
MYAELKEEQIDGVTVKTIASIHDEEAEGLVLCGRGMEVGAIYAGGGFIPRARARLVQPTRTSADARSEKFAELSERRKRAETEFRFSGAAFYLDEGTQQRISGAIQYLELSGAPSVRWQVSRGQFATLNLPTLQALGRSAGAHIQACFANVESIASLIVQAGDDIQAIDAVSVEDGWP